MLGACRELGLTDVNIVGPDELDQKQPLGGGHAFVIAAVVASGRSILNISRQLRTLHNGQHIHYYIGVVRPRSEEAWKGLSSDLGWGDGPNYYPVSYRWKVVGEPDRQRNSPWRSEIAALRRIEQDLPVLNPDSTHDGKLNAIASRINEASDFNNPRARLFVPSDYSVTGGTYLQLAPNFAFWGFPYATNESAGGDLAVPTQDEVFFTMSAVLHKFRHSSEGRYALFGVPGHGYVIDPLMFDRFNDPIIQSSILRAARGVELDYHSHSETSSRMTDIIMDILEHYRDAAYGGAAAEFILSIIRGRFEAPLDGGMRLADDDLSRLLTVEVSARHAPLLVALLHHLRENHPK